LVNGGALDEYIVRPAQRGLSRLTGGAGIDSGGIAGGIGRGTDAIAEGYSPTVKFAQQELANTDGALAKAGKVLTDPVLLGQFAAEQVPMLAGLGLGTAGTAARAVGAAT